VVRNSAEVSPGVPSTPTTPVAGSGTTESPSHAWFVGTVVIIVEPPVPGLMLHSVALPPGPEF
jgi:hypothetical protein